ncbi:MAG TPA: SpoIIE family protein phosphatase [Syntrophorhabdaceae bacterium]|nr:SpoIIE family protein phosphatase [Syntrophorhabdaceae bacterium]
MTKDQSNPRKYIETVVFQRAKKPGGICGDHVVIDRTPEATTAVLADGIGTGIKAQIAAVMCSSRLMELTRQGFTLREACRKIVDTMHQARTSDIPFAAFSVCRVLNNGQATIISYEIPHPILVNNRLAAYLPKPRSFPLGLEMVAETNCTLEFGDGIVLVSDGVSQAGLGHQYRLGWSIQGASDFINGLLIQGSALNTIPEKIVQRVKEISGHTYGDDTTCLLLTCRESKTLNILSGPPGNRAMDSSVIRDFMRLNGAKAVCGSTTVEIVARHLKQKVTMNAVSTEFHKPPAYTLKGIDLATEGAITLNQVYNILEEKESKLAENSAVSDLYRLLHEADAVNIIIGTASNPAHKAIIFRQMGVLPREAIIPLLIEKLRKLGKLISVRAC